MQALLDMAKWLVGHWEDVVLALNALVAGLIAVALLIPGDQPEKAFKAFAAFLAKFSRKPPEPKE